MYFFNRFVLFVLEKGKVMDNTELAMKIRLQAWMQDQHEYAANNMGVNEWCAYKHISRNTFFYRQRKLREAAANAVSGNEDALHALTNFVQVPPALCEKVATSEVSKTETPIIRISRGSLNIEIDSAQLRTALEVLANAK